MLGYHDLPHEPCLEGRWDDLRQYFAPNSDPGAVTRHINQVRCFYEAPSDAIWVTFHADCMWWCRSFEGVEIDESGTRFRRAIGAWSKKDLLGRELLKSQLSGKLLAVESFRGTICSISERTYLLHKLNGTSEPHVEAARSDFNRLVESAIPVIKNLHFKDFETLVDLIFRQSGWQRTGVSGETVKDIDLDLMSPITKERVAVQVKAKATKQTYDDYVQRLGRMDSYARRYLVTHTPSPGLIEHAASSASELELWTPDVVARHTVSTGLIEWLLDKAG